jgi:hypothetical protein
VNFPKGQSIVLTCLLNDLIVTKERLRRVRKKRAMIFPRRAWAIAAPHDLFPIS